MWATLLRVETPSCAWCRAASQGDPPVSIRLLSHVPAGEGRVVEEVELVGAGWAERLEDIRALPSVFAASLLEEGRERARVRLEIASCPLQRAVARSGALPRFPFDVRAGFDEWLVIAERDQTARFVHALRADGVRVDIVSSREHRPHDSLTGRQRELMQEAIRSGYYEVPRRVTLTALAQRLGLSKSTLSETLARGERRVLDELRPGP